MPKLPQPIDHALPEPAAHHAHPEARRGSLSRRELVTGSLLGMTAAGAATLTTLPVGAQAAPTQQNDLGYRETQYVQRYYALARR